MRRVDAPNPPRKDVPGSGLHRAGKEPIRSVPPDIPEGKLPAVALIHALKDPTLLFVRAGVLGEQRRIARDLLDITAGCRGVRREGDNHGVIAVPAQRIQAIGVRPQIQHPRPAQMNAAHARHDRKCPIGDRCRAAVPAAVRDGGNGVAVGAGQRGPL